MPRLSAGIHHLTPTVPVHVFDAPEPGPTALIQAGIQLDHANARNGQVLLLAGAHRYTRHWYSWGAEHDLPVVALESEPGDLTVHFGDTMHTTPPPTADQLCVRSQNSRGGPRSE